MRKEELQKNDIHYLRKYARELGVYKRSNLRKNELIEKIIEVENGIVSPKFNKQGRPALNKGNEFIDYKVNLESHFYFKINEILDEIKNEIISILKKKFEY